MNTYNGWDITHYRAIQDGAWVSVTTNTHLECGMRLAALKIRDPRTGIVLIVDLTLQRMQDLEPYALRTLLKDRNR